MQMANARKWQRVGRREAIAKPVRLASNLGASLASRLASIQTSKPRNERKKKLSEFVASEDLGFRIELVSRHRFDEAVKMDKESIDNVVREEIHLRKLEAEIVSSF